MLRPRAEVGRQEDPQGTFVLVGGAGFVGTAATRILCERGANVVVVDRRRPRYQADGSAVRWIPCDLLTDDVTLPDDKVVILVGNADPRPRWAWTLPLDIAVTTARLLPQLRDRPVVLISSVEVYGDAPPPLAEDTPPSLPMAAAELEAWCEDVRLAARQPCPPWRVAGLCRRLVDCDPSGRWVYGMAKLAQELLVRSVADADRCTVLRLANAVGLGQERVVTHLVRSTLAGRPIQLTPGALRSFLPVEELGRLVALPLAPGVFNIGSHPISVGELAATIGRLCGAPVPWVPVSAPASDSCGVVDTSRAEAAGLTVCSLEKALGDLVDRLRNGRIPLFDPPLPVVVPPRPAKPDEVADRQQAAIWSGRLKHGNRWTTVFRDRLRGTLELDGEDELLITRSGTDALRLAIAGTAGPAKPGQVAVLPSFTHHATVDVLVQLGYGLRFVDIDPWSWTLDPEAVETALSDGTVSLVVCVDTFGNPCSYPTLADMCRQSGVPLVADSAAALGSTCSGRPVGTQADAHAFSMSFAKALTAAGAGGAVVFAAEARRRDLGPWLSSSLMDELHAAAALDQLVLLPDLVRRRNWMAQTYQQAASRVGGLVTQGVAPQNRHSYVHWVVQAPDREHLARELALLGVETKQYFPAQHLNHELRAPSVHLPVTERLDREVLALPMSSELSDGEAELVAVAVEEAFRSMRRAQAANMTRTAGSVVNGAGGDSFLGQGHAI